MKTEDKTVQDLSNEILANLEKLSHIGQPDKLYDEPEIITEMFGRARKFPGGGRSNGSQV